MASRLERALARFRRRERPPVEAYGRLSDARFRAVAEEKLRTLEREVAEVKGRLNGLIFVVAGAVVAQVMLKLVE
jgi:hypothetical protein